MLYMVIEHFRNEDPVPVYRRFRDRGRLAPEGLQYVSSWVDEGLARCFQLMETSERRLLDEWMAHWSDIVNFEVYPVVTSKQAADAVASRL
jgi:Protein of unknown function (DUF3303)